MGKRNSQLQELTVVAQNDYLTIVDTSAGQSKRVSVKTLVGNVDLGWVATGESWTFSSWTSASRIGVATVPSDATTKYTPGMRVRFSQTTGGTKYGIITYVTSTTLTIFFPSGVTFTNETITSPVYSSIKVPYGFNTDPSVWELTYGVTSNTATNVGSFNNWVNPGGANVSVGPGAWKVSIRGSMTQVNSSASGQFSRAGIGTTNNSVVDNDCFQTTYVRTGSTSSGAIPFSLEKYFVNTSATTYYMNATAETGAGTVQVGFLGGINGNALLKALCAYL